MRRGKDMQRGIVWMTGGERQARTAERCVLVLVAILLLLPFVAGTILVADPRARSAIYVLMGLGLNIVVGYAGLLDLGYVAFFAVGAYITACSPAAC